MWYGLDERPFGTEMRIQRSTEDSARAEEITYDYDDLYRLTEATYTGGVAAHYEYAYDAVGNMEAYTETVDAETMIVNRTFDAANQLQTAIDAVAGTSSYYYDGNGNMVQVLPPGVVAGGAGEQLYSFNQRNLLTNNSVSAGSGSYTPLADYVYDGAGDRVQQIAAGVTTTYANDVVGMTQVLLANDGTTQVASLYGLDLIGQDDGTGMRLLLADGLGSVRQEMAGGAVETVTTYGPYGTLLAQTGSSGTVYGYTGEQEDVATGLVYLRARYYNPTLNQFQSRDPWSGNMRHPKTLTAYPYVFGNPVRFNDPNGMQCNDTSQEWCTSIMPGGGTVGIETPPYPNVMYQGEYNLPSDMRYAGMWYILRYVTERYMVNIEQNSGFGCDSPTLISGGGGIEAVNGKQFIYPRDDIWAPLQCYRSMYRGSIGNSACAQADLNYREYNANARVGVNAAGIAGIYGYGETGINEPGGEVGLQIDVGPAGFNSGTTGVARINEFSMTMGKDLGVCSAGTTHTIGTEAPNQIYVVVPAARYHDLNGSGVRLREIDYHDVVPNYYEYAGVVYESNVTTYANNTRGFIVEAVRKGKIATGAVVRNPYEEWEDGIHPTPLVCYGR